MWKVHTFCDLPVPSMPKTSFRGIYFYKMTFFMTFFPFLGLSNDPKASVVADTTSLFRPIRAASQAS